MDNNLNDGEEQNKNDASLIALHPVVDKRGIGV